MPWVVDTCLLIDIAEDDPQFGRLSALLLDAKREEGLVICPVTYVELAPVFEGSTSDAEDFLALTGIRWPEVWMLDDTRSAFRAWADLVVGKRQGRAGKRPVADVLIGAFALRHQGLMTRNVGDFRRHFPTLPIVSSAETR